MSWLVDVSNSRQKGFAERTRDLGGGVPGDACKGKKRR